MKDYDSKIKLFWEIAEPFLANGEADEGTMMGFKCLRHKGEFVVSLDKNTGGMIIKLPRETVGEMVASGEAQQFAPNGKVFKEWALINDYDENTGEAYVGQALDFAKSKQPEQG